MKDDVIEQLFYGNVTPGEQYFKRDGEYAEAMQRLTDAEDKLRQTLDKDDRDALDTLTSAQREIDSLTAAAAFKRGFCLAARIAFCVLDTENDPTEPID